MALSNEPPWELPVLGFAIRSVSLFNWVEVLADGPAAARARFRFAGEGRASAPRM